MPLALILLYLGSFTGSGQSAEINASFERAAALQRNGALAEAAAEYRKVLALAPDYAEAQANLGAVLSRLGNYEEAIAAYESALRLNPKLTPILLNLGIAHYRAGQFAQAVAALERFLAVAPDHLQARQLIGLSLVELGRDAEAVTQLEPTLSAVPDDVTVLYSLGLAYLRLRRPELASAQQRLAARADGVALARLLQGQAHVELFEFEKAAEELAAAAKLSPDLPRLHFLRGLTYLKLGRPEEARAFLERELGRTPIDFLTLYYLASLLETRGDLSAARQPQHAETRYLLARSYQKLGRRQEAAREFAEVERLKAQEREKERKPNP